MKILFIIWPLIVAFQCCSQNQSISNLRKRIYEISGREKISVFRSFANTIHYNNSWGNESNDTSFFKRKINRTLKKKDYYSFNRTLMSYALLFHNPKTQDSSMINYLNQLYVNQKQDNEIRADILGCEGYIYRNNRMYSKSIEKYEQELMYIPKYESTRIIYFGNSGILYSEMGMYKESLSNYMKALEILRHQKSAYSKTDICFLGALIGEDYINLGDNKNALKYLKPALDNISIFRPEDAASVYSNTGKAYILSDSLKKAEYFINVAINIFDSLNIKEGKLSSLNSLGIIFMQNNNAKEISKTIKELSSLLNSPMDSSVNKYYISQSYQLLSNYYEKKGDYKKSNTFLKKGTAVYDTYLKETNLKLNELKKRFEAAQINEQMKLQHASLRNKKNIIHHSLVDTAIVIIIMLVITTLYWKRHLTNVTSTNQNPFRRNMLGGYSIGKREHHVISEDLKNHILALLTEQINDKVYLEPDLTLKTLAKKCRTNSTYLSGIIHERYHVNFNNFINKYRIKEAQQLLLDPHTDIPLKALPESLGFKNYARFHEAFKKQTGISPSVFIKNNRNP